MPQPAYNKTYRWVDGKRTVFSARLTTGFGAEVDVSQFQNIGVVVIGGALVAGTLKCQGSFFNVEDIDFSAAVGASNPWDYVGMYDLEDGSFIDGDTGIALAADDVKQYTVNTDALRSLNFHLSAISGGPVTVLVYATNNQ